MIIEKIWKNYNISFILILPLYKDIIRNIKDKNDYNITIQSLFYNCGLINTYLLNTKGEFDKTLKLVFKKDMLLNSNLTDVLNKPVSNLLDLILSSKYFNTIRDTEDHLIIYLDIDNKWLKDIDKIVQGKYTEVSNEYKKFITYEGTYKLSGDDLIDYLYISNLPAKITNKHNSLEKLIKDIFKVEETEILDEVFPIFDRKKETLNLKIW